MEELSQESAEYYKSKIDSYKKQNDDLNIKISELEKIYYGFFLKLDYYEQNSNVKPPEEIDVSIYKQELQFNVLHNKWRKEKETLVADYEDKIEKLLGKLKNTSNVYQFVFSYFLSLFLHLLSFLFKKKFNFCFRMNKRA